MLLETVLINSWDFKQLQRSKEQWENVRKLKSVPFILCPTAVTLGFVLSLNTGIQAGLQRLSEGTEGAKRSQGSAELCKHASHALNATAASSCHGVGGWGGILLARPDHQFFATVAPQKPRPV